MKSLHIIALSALILFNSSIREFSTPSPIDIYPDPANSMITIRTGDHEWDDSPVLIYNSLGLLVKISRLNGLSVSVDVSDFTEGVYCVMLNHGAKAKFLFINH